MANMLSEAQVRSYWHLGYHFPVRVLTLEQAAENRRSLEAVEARLGGPLSGAFRHKCHLLFPWLAALVRHPSVVDAVASLLGPDLLCWNTNIFCKEPRDPGFISWHQDSVYFGLSDTRGLTAWVALTESNSRSGCMRVVSRTHHTKELPHVERPSRYNMLTRGQEVAADLDEAKAVDLILEPGEMSLHDFLIVHGSNPNESGGRRIGIAIRYIPTSIRQLGGRDTATLARGTDDFGYFEPEPLPDADFSPEAIEEHARIVEIHTRLLMKGAEGSTLR